MSLLKAALWYGQKGMSVIPTKSKLPAKGILWQHFQRRRANEITIRMWDDRNMLTGIGLVCGEVSNNLVVIDLDNKHGENGVEKFELTFPHLTKTFTVASGSGKGKHYYYRVKNMPKSLRPEGFGVEIRGNGCYVIAPPSALNDDGSQAYKVIQVQTIAELDDLLEVEKWLYSVAREANDKKRLKINRARVDVGYRNSHGIPNVAYPAAWANAALKSECTEVSAAPVGSRNNRLFRAALKLGQIASTGLLSEKTVEHCLLNAASSLVYDDGEGTVLRTIDSGLSAGRSHGGRDTWRK